MYYKAAIMWRRGIYSRINLDEPYNHGESRRIDKPPVAY